MMYRIANFIGMLVIVLVLLGHHSFQAYAIEAPSHHHGEEVSCLAHDCHHVANMEICEKIQSNELQISSDSLVLAELPGYPYTTSAYEGDSFPEEIFKRYHERIPISHSQFPRSHLA